MNAQNRIATLRARFAECEVTNLKSISGGITLQGLLDVLNYLEEHNPAQLDAICGTTVQTEDYGDVNVIC